MTKRHEARVRRLGDVLVEHGLITREQRRSALRKQRHFGGRLGEILVHDAVLTRDQLNWALGNLLRIPYVELDAPAIDPELLASVPLDLLRRCQAVPVVRLGSELSVAMADPTDLQALEDIQAATGAQVRVAMADPAAVQRVLSVLAERAARPAPRSIRLPAERERRPSRSDILGDPSGATLVKHHLLLAVSRGADEVLIEPADGVLRVRCRAHRHALADAEYPASLLATVVHRLKLMAGMDISSGALVQQGEAELEAPGKAWSLLVSVTAGMQGPSARIELRPSRGDARPLGRLGFDAATLARLRQAAKARAGLAIACGPLGSGCSTTLYALARVAAAQGRQVVAVEGRASLRCAWATQVEASGDETYFAALGSLAEHPPDVLVAERLEDPRFWSALRPATLASTLLLGEMRAADSVTALALLRENGLPGAVLAGALHVIVGQRLVARPGGVTLESEALDPNEEMRDLLLDGAPTARVRDAWLRAGGGSLRRRRKPEDA